MARFERVDGVLIVRRDECHVAAPRDLTRDVDTVESRHMDVQERKVRRVGLDGRQRGEAVAGSRDDPQLRPQRFQHIRQLVGEQRLVLGENRDGREVIFRRVRRAPLRLHSRRHPHQRA